jgi:hypothetical protein
MYDRIRFTFKHKSLHVSCDPVFVTAHIAYHEKDNEIHLLERNFEGFEVTEPISIYDNYKGLQYNITREGDGFKVTMEEMSLNNLLNLGLPREALDETIILQKKLLNPR